jgi:hypothetical protein
MKITREFAPADRYLYDFGLCDRDKEFVAALYGSDRWGRNNSCGSPRIDPGFGPA